MSRKQNFLISVLIIFLISLIIVTVALVIVPPIWGQIQVNLSIQRYNNAEKIFEDSAVWGAGSTLKSLYYWSEDSFDKILDFYKHQGHQFVLTSDEYGEWAITGFSSEGKEILPDTSSYFISHGSFCHYTERYSCITLAILRANQPNLHQLAIMSPSTFRRLDAMPELTPYLSNGTIIVVNYYVIDY